MTPKFSTLNILVHNTFIFRRSNLTDLSWVILQNQVIFTCSKSTIETLEKPVKYVRS